MWIFFLNFQFCTPIFFILFYNLNIFIFIEIIKIKRMHSKNLYLYYKVKLKICRSFDFKISLH